MNPSERLEKLLQFVVQSPEDVHLSVEEGLGMVDLIVYCRAGDVPLLVGPSGNTIHSLSVVASCFWHGTRKRARFPGNAIRGINATSPTGIREWDKDEFEREAVALAGEVFAVKDRNVISHRWITSSETGIEKLHIEVDTNDDHDPWAAVLGKAVQDVCAAAAKARRRTNVNAWIVGASSLSGYPDRG